MGSIELWCGVNECEACTLAAVCNNAGAVPFHFSLMPGRMDVVLVL